EGARHALRSNLWGGARGAGAGAAIGDLHVAADAAGDLKADPVAGGASRSGSGSIEGARFPGAGNAGARHAELAPDLDTGGIALAPDGHAELRAAAGVVSIAGEPLRPAVCKLDL